MPWIDLKTSQFAVNYGCNKQTCSLPNQKVVLNLFRCILQGEPACDENQQVLASNRQEISVESLQDRMFSK
jgi:hypothetical protein